jgi:hypothetical protein
MLYGNCMECKHFDECYAKAETAKELNNALVIYFSALWKRDLCVNNDKYGWERKM